MIAVGEIKFKKIETTLTWCLMAISCAVQAFRLAAYFINDRAESSQKKYVMAKWLFQIDLSYYFLL